MSDLHQPNCAPDSEVSAAPKAAFVTLGCKINFYDTQAIRESVRQLGYRESNANGDVDLVVVNSCTVTDKAGGKSVAAVRRLARNNPHAKVIVTGCMTAEDRTALADIDQVQHVVGNEEKDQIPALIQGAPRGPAPGRRSRNIFKLSANEFHHQTRAYLKVHDGCDSFCTYCIIPYLRGKSMSRQHDDVIEEARRFVDSGHRELVLTGIHLSQYGKDLGRTGGLVDLLVELRQLPGVDRVRLSSIGEGAFTDPFLDAFANDPGLCQFFHIPLQSGSDTVLERMRRDYTVAEYLHAIDRIRDRLPNAVITTDLMVGFPGETDREFEQSLATCERAAFAKMHIFPYSSRSRTKAARFPDHVNSETKAIRMRAARQLEERLIEQSRQRWVGRHVQVLVERVEAVQDGFEARGQSREGLLTRFELPTKSLPTGAPREHAQEQLRNHEWGVEVTTYRGTDLLGRALEPREREPENAVSPSLPQQRIAGGAKGDIRR